MRKKDFQELRTKEAKELKTLLGKKRQEGVRTVLEVRTNKVKNVHTARLLRRDIAQIATLIREKEARVKD